MPGCTRGSLEPAESRQRSHQTDPPESAPDILPSVMEAPAAPRPEDFSLRAQDVARLRRHWFAPVFLLDPPSANASLIIRCLRPEYLMAVAAGCASYLFFELLRSGGSTPAMAMLITTVATVVYVGPVGAFCGMAISALLVRPLYLAAASVCLRGFTRFRRFQLAELKYERDSARYRIRQQRVALRFWRSRSGVELERELARVYRKLGFEVALTSRTRHGRVDLVLRHEGHVTAVRCKANRIKVRIGVGRELVSAAEDLGADRSVIACTRGVSPTLAAYARERGIDILTARELVDLQMSAKLTPAIAVQTQGEASVAALPVFPSPQTH